MQLQPHILLHPKKCAAWYAVARNQHTAPRLDLYSIVSFQQLTLLPVQSYSHSLDALGYRHYYHAYYYVTLATHSKLWFLLQFVPSCGVFSENGTSYQCPAGYVSNATAGSAISPSVEVCCTGGCMLGTLLMTV